jgi:hypothetical protein
MCHFLHPLKMRSENIGKLKRSNKFALKIHPLGLCPKVYKRLTLFSHSISETDQVYIL